jgi:hypothetical protein
VLLQLACYTLVLVLFQSLGVRCNAVEGVSDAKGTPRFDAASVKRGIQTALASYQREWRV